MSATARLLGWCVALGLTLSVSSVLAGSNLMAGGTHVSWMALAQTDQGNSAESRRAAEKWLRQAREAIKDGKFDLAEYCIERAEKLNVKYDPLTARFKDTPAKARKDLESQRAKGSEPNVVAFAGDGATVDAGFQAVSGAAERGDRIIYFCYDNEGYMNTGY